MPNRLEEEEGEGGTISEKGNGGKTPTKKDFFLKKRNFQFPFRPHNYTLKYFESIFVFGGFPPPPQPMFIHFQKSGGGDETGIMTDGGQTQTEGGKKKRFHGKPT